MDIKSLSEIHFAEYNPRTLSDHMGAALDASMATFGDLSGVTFNAQSQTLITGHQRLRILQKRYGPDRIKIYIEHRTDVPDEYGTIATGFVAVEGTNLHLAYREVMFDAGKEKAANVAANKVEAQFDDQLLAQLNYDLSQLENGDELLALTGQTEDEVTKLLQSVGVGPEPEEPEEQPEKPEDQNKVTFALSPDQKAVVDQALAMAKELRAIPHTNLDNINGTALYYICKNYVETNTANQTTDSAATLPAAA